MAFSTGGGGRKIRSFNDINVTPLTDIFLVLLIIMMVIAPMFQKTNKDINVPTVKSGQPIEEQTVTVEVSKTGDISLDGKVLPGDKLVAALKPLTQGKKDMILTLRADGDATGEPVMKVFDAAGEAGFKKLIIAGEPPKAKSASKLPGEG